MNRIAAPKLDVRDLELVLALAATGTTVKAATRLHLTQSAVSRGLLLAEEKLGVRLFDRLPRGLRPTAAGMRLIQGAGPLLSQLAALEQEARAPATAPLRVRLVCECYTAYRWLPSALAQLQRTGDSLDVRLRPEHTDDPLAGLLEEELDVAFLTFTPARPPLLSAPLFTDEMIFLLASDHPLSKRKWLQPEDLEGSTLIFPSQAREGERRWFRREVFGKRRPVLRALRFPLTEAIVDAVRAGLGIGVLSEWVADGYVRDGGLLVKRLRGKSLRRPWRLAYRKDSADAAHRLAAAVAGRAPRLQTGTG